MSQFRVQIVRQDGAKVRFRPGSHEEHDLIAAVVSKAVSKGVGVFRTEAKVKQAITEAIREVLHDVKFAVLP